MQKLLVWQIRLHQQVNADVETVRDGASDRLLKQPFKTPRETIIFFFLDLKNILQKSKAAFVHSVLLTVVRRQWMQFANISLIFFK